MARERQPLDSATELGARGLETALGATGQGGMGAVFEAEHTGIGSRVAVKVLYPEVAQRRENVLRFRREAQAAGTIGHPGIVRVHDLGQTDDGTAYLVMDYVEGRSLAQLVRDEGVVEPRRALAIVEQVLAALGAAHERGIVHRDVKPENVLVCRPAGPDGPEEAKVLDFGISKFRQVEPEAQGLTRTGTILGTPLYMAPEQARGEGDIDLRVVTLLPGSDGWPAANVLDERVALDGLLPCDVALRVSWAGVFAVFDLRGELGQLRAIRLDGSGDPDREPRHVLRGTAAVGERPRLAAGVAPLLLYIGRSDPGSVPDLFAAQLVVDGAGLRADDLGLPTGSEAEPPELVLAERGAGDLAAIAVVRSGAGSTALGSTDLVLADLPSGSRLPLSLSAAGVPTSLLLQPVDREPDLHYLTLLSGELAESPDRLAAQAGPAARWAHVAEPDPGRSGELRLGWLTTGELPAVAGQVDCRARSAHLARRHGETALAFVRACDLFGSESEEPELARRTTLWLSLVDPRLRPTAASVEVGSWASSPGELVTGHEGTDASARDLVAAHLDAAVEWTGERTLVVAWTQPEGPDREVVVAQRVGCEP